jgi:acyl carrier protein
MNHNAAVEVGRNKTEIIDWCSTFIAEMLGIPPEKLNPNAEFESFGLDSVATVSLVAELEEWLHREVSPSLLFEYPTLSSFADYLSQSDDAG